MFVFIWSLSFLPGCFKNFLVVFRVVWFPYVYGFIFLLLRTYCVTFNRGAHIICWTGISIIQAPINSFPDHPHAKAEQTPVLIRSVSSWDTLVPVYSFTTLAWESFFFPFYLFIFLKGFSSLYSLFPFLPPSLPLCLLSFPSFKVGCILNFFLLYPAFICICSSTMSVLL